MAHEWLKSPLICNGQTIRPALTPELVTVAQLPDICLRMQLILETIEFAHGEGRLINLDVFEPIDTMESELRHGRIGSFSDWHETMTRFANFYHLDGSAPIEITQRAIDHLSYFAGYHGISLTGDS